MPCESIHWGILNPGHLTKGILRYFHKKFVKKNRFVCNSKSHSCCLSQVSCNASPRCCITMRFGLYHLLVKNLLRVKNCEWCNRINQTSLQVWMAYLLGTYLLQRLVILTTASISDVLWLAFHGFEEDGLKLAFHCSSGGGWEGGCEFVWFGIFLQCNLLATQEDQHNWRLMDLHEILVTMIVSLFGLSSLLFLKRFGMLSIDPIFEINLFHNW